MSLNYFVVNFSTLLWLFDNSLLYYYINLNVSIMYSLFSGDIYLSLDISLGISSSFPFITVFEFFVTFVVLIAILLPIKSPVASAVFQLIFLKEF